MTTKVMSSEDFRAQLYQSLQGRGILDSLKSQLRNRLAVELHKTMEGSTVSFSPPKSPRKSMRHQVADSMVAEYLKNAGYEYSLSIFLPEAGISLDKLIAEEDLIRFLQISPTSSLYRHLQSQLSASEDGFLDKLLEALIASHDCAAAVPMPIHCGGNRTTPAPSPLLRPPSEPSVSHHSSPAKKSIADRLEELDTSYARRAEEESAKCQLSLESRLSAFQRDTEARYKQQLETEMELYRNRELAKVRLEERQKYQEELTKEKETLHRAQQLKLEEVRKSEQRMLEKYRRKEQDLEAGIYSQRQTLLDELNTLRQKEGRLKRELELDRRAVALEKDRAKTVSEQLETNMAQMRAEVERKAEEGCTEKLEYELSLKSKRSELERRETQLRTDMETVESLKLENRKLSGEMIEQRRQMEKLQTQLQESTWSEIGLQKQKDETQMKQIQFADYDHLKQKVAEQKKQLSLSENKYGELKASYKQQQLTLKQLQARLSQPNLELHAQQAEVERLRKAHHREMLVLEYDNKQLGRHLAAQTEHSHQLQRRLDEQLLQLKTAQREVQDMHTLLEHAYPHAAGQRKQDRAMERAGSKSVPSPSKKTSRSTRSSGVQHRQASKVTPPSHSSLSNDSNIYPLDLGPTTPEPRKGGRSVSFFDTSGAFLAESRATIERMEKDAEQLERTYRDFNHPVLGSAGGGLPSGLLPGSSLTPDLDISSYPLLYDKYGGSGGGVPMPSFTPPPPTMPVLSSIRTSSACSHSHANPPLSVYTPPVQPGTRANFSPSPPPLSPTLPPMSFPSDRPGVTALASTSPPAPLPPTESQPPPNPTPTPPPPAVTTATVETAKPLPASTVTPPSYTYPTMTTTTTTTTDQVTRTSVSSASDTPSLVTSVPTESAGTTRGGGGGGGSAAVQQKSVISLESWWSASKPDTATNNMFSVQETKEETRSSVGPSTTTTATAKDVTRSNVGPSTTTTATAKEGTRSSGGPSTTTTGMAPVPSLTESTYTPLPSVAASTASRELRRKEESTGPGGLGRELAVGGGGIEEDRRDTGLKKEHLETKTIGREVPLAHPPLPTAESKPASTGSNGVVLGGRAANAGSSGAVLGGQTAERQKPKEEEEDGIDPVMLKYMQLVKEKRQGQQTEQQLKVPLTGHHSEEFDVSQEVGGGFEDFSNHDDDDPFENW